MSPSRVTRVLLAVSLGLVALTGCTTPIGPDAGETPTGSSELSVEEAYLAHAPSEGIPRMPYDATVEQGDDVIFLLRDVGPFSQAPDNDRRGAALTLVVRDAEGEPVHRDSANATLGEPEATGFQIPWKAVDAPPSEYTAEATVTDKVTGDEASVELDLAIVETVDRSRSSFGASGWTYLLDKGEGGPTFRPIATYPSGSEVQFGLVDVGPFAEGEDGNHHPAASLTVRDSDGNTILSENTTYEPQRAPDGVFPALTMKIGLPASETPGNFTLSMTVEDRIEGSTTEDTREFEIFSR
jgi:hypothetical protein